MTSAPSRAVYTVGAFALLLVCQTASVSGFAEHGLSSSYSPFGKNWAAVVADCLNAGREEKRLYSFFTRAAFHDALSVAANVPCTNCGGTDGSLLLTSNETNRIENQLVDNWSAITATAVLKIADAHKVSVADTLSVCGFVAPNGLNPSVDLFKLSKLPVGRQDNNTPAPPNQLAPPFFQLDAFRQFYTKFKLTIEEAVALMGSHTTIRKQGCTQENPRTGKLEECNPDTSPCQNLRMYQFDNHYYKDACFKPSTTTVDPKNVPFIVGIDLSQATTAEKAALRKEQICKWTSASRRAAAEQELNDAISKAVKRVPADLFVQSQDFVNSTKLVPKDPTAFGTIGGKPRSWPYTAHDARMASACQGNDNPDIKTAMLKFASNKQAFFEVYARAYVKMVSVGAKFPKGNLAITGRECPRGWKSKIQKFNKLCKRLCQSQDSQCPAHCFC